MDKIIAVCGATGSQGGAVVDVLLKSSYKVRGLTRRVDSDKAKALKDRGVEIVRADFDDNQSLLEAFKGCYGAYLNTNYWEHGDPKKEISQAKALADACKEANVKHVVYSTLEDTRCFQDNEIPMMGEYKVAHFDTKGEIKKYIEEIGLPAAFLYTSFYAENFSTIGKFKTEPDGVHKLYLPMKKAKLVVVVLEDIGKMVAAILDKNIFGDVGLASEHLTGDEIAATLAQATGKKFAYVAISADDYRNLGFPGAKEMGNMFQFYQVHEKKFTEMRSMEKVKKLITPTPFLEWCNKNKDNVFVL